MFARSISLLTVIMMSSLASTASGQDTPRIGLAMGYPTSICVIWQVTDGLALRPEISIQKRSGQFATLGVATTFDGGVASAPSFSSSVSTDDFWEVSLGLSAIITLSRHDALRTYVSPRWAYLRDASHTSSEPPDSFDSGSAASGHLVSGSFGAQYAFSKRFSAFGEVGVEFTRTVATPDVGTARLFGAGQTVLKSLGSRSAAGIILFF